MKKNYKPNTKSQEQDAVPFGYERFFSEPNDLTTNEITDNTIVSVHRSEQITTLVGNTSKQNKIKISLSQEQIVNGAKGNGIRRSQSINIQKNIYSPVAETKHEMTIRAIATKPSLIPIKINSPSSMFSSLNVIERQKLKMNPLHLSEYYPTESEKSRIARKFSIPSSLAPSINELRSDGHSLPYIPRNYSVDNHNIKPETDKINDEFKCKFCHETLRDPRVLDCLHTFCMECLFEFETSTKSSVKVNLAPNPIRDKDFSPKTESDDSTSSERLSALPSRRKSSTLSTVNIKKLFSTPMNSKKTEDRKQSIVSQSCRRLGAVTEKNKTILTCPLCSYRTEIQIGGIARVPKNFLLERQLQNKLNSLDVKNSCGKCCNLCYEKIEAIYHCVNCSWNLCDLCKESHLRQRNTSRHDIEILQQNYNAIKEENVQQIKAHQKCFVHPSQELKLYCTTCDQVACHNCTILLHKGHKYETILKASKGHLKLMKDALERNRKFYDYVIDSISKLANSVKKIDHRADIVQSEIEQFLNDYFEALEAHKQTLLRQVAKAKESKHLIIAEQQEYLEKRATEAKIANTFAENLLSNGIDIEILTFVGTLLRRFECCQKSESSTSIEPKVPDALQFLPELRAPATQAQHNIPLYGIIATQKADPKYCILEIVEPIVVRLYRRVEFRMLSKDSDDRPMCHGGITLDVMVRYKDAPNKLITVHVSDKRDGSYVIGIIPDVVGLILMSIKIQGNDIKGSPFTIAARALRPHSGVYHCCTFCSSKGSKTIICACNGKMSGYNGCGHGHDGHPGRRHWSCCANVFETSECSATNTFL